MRCKWVAVICVILAITCLCIFWKAVWTPGPDTMKVTMRSYFSQNIRHSYYHENEREIYEVWNTVYSWYDDTLLIEILANSTPPDELKYLDTNSMDKWLCEVHIKPCSSCNELKISALSGGYIGFHTNKTDHRYEIGISEDGQFYEVEYPIVHLLDEPQSINIVMKFNVGKIKRDLDITVDMQINSVRGAEDYTIELHLPKDYRWSYFTTEKEENQILELREGEKRFGVFRNHGDGTIHAGASRPLSIDRALVFAVAMWFFGYSADEFIRTCSPLKWMKRDKRTKE